MWQGSNYQLLSLASSPNKQSNATVSASSFSEDPQPPQAYGVPARKSLFNLVDCIAVFVSLACLGVAIGAVSPKLRYAAELQYTKQIIVLGFALGIMNQCLKRVLPHMFLLLETRFGSSTIQNYDGIIRWTPLADKISLMWRAALTVLLILPLALGIAYKRHTGGIGVIDVSGNGTFYTPTYPHGLSNIGELTAIANVTAPFMAATANDSVPVDFGHPQAYGFNILLLSNASAAAVDAPNQLYVKDLQSQLAPGVAYNLTAPVRGTVATFNATVETHRDDDSFWEKYISHANLVSVPLPGSIDLTQVGLLHQESAGCDLLECYDASWAFLGVFTLPSGLQNDSSEVATTLFKGKALGFDISRHNCTVTWQITANSMELVSGQCHAEPLPYVYQYLKDCQSFFTAAYFLPLAGDCVGPFNTSRSQSHWRIPTYSVVAAAMFWSRIAGQNGYMAVQVGGPISSYWTDSEPEPVDEWQYNNMITEAEARGDIWKFNETYPLNHTLLKQVPTLRPEATLYLVLATQPVLTIIAFLAGLVMYRMPISRGFGMVAMLAGIDKTSVDLLSGAAFSGILKNPTGLRIKVIDDSMQKDEGHRVEYIIGERGSQGEVKSRTKYS